MEKKSKNQHKDLIQERAVISSTKHNHLVLEWSTGCGKTLASIKIVQEILNNNPSAEGYIVCKESTHIGNWKEDINKHGFGHILDNVKFILYASAHKMLNADFYIFDECHGLTLKRMAVIEKLIRPNTKAVYLSATIPQDKKYLIQKLSRGTAKYYKIPLVMAINLGILPEPKVVVHKLKLDNNDDRIYEFIMKKGRGTVTETCHYHNRWSLFNKYSNVRLSVMCNEYEYYQLLSNQIEYFGKRSEDPSLSAGDRQACRNRRVNLGSQRKKFIAQAKSRKAVSLVHEFRKKGIRFICFTGSIEQSETLGVGSAVHSKNKKGVNEHLIECFNNMSCSELFAVKMLRESVNLTDVEKGIIVQLDSTIGSFYQMLGRCLRHDYPEMHLLILEGTQDQVYFESALSDFDETFIEYGEHNHRLDTS